MKNFFWLLIPLLSGCVSGSPGADTTPALRKRVLEADWIVRARVEEVKVEYELPSKNWILLRCRPAEVLKGNEPGKEIEVRYRVPKPEGSGPVKEGEPYWMFLRGDSIHNLELISAEEGVLKAEKQIQLPGREEESATRLDENLFRARVGNWVLEGPGIREVGIHVRMEGGWMAMFTVHATGRIHGSHVSGGEHPFVHMEDGMIQDPEVLAEVQALATKIHSSDLPSDPEIRGNDLVYIQIQPYQGAAKVYQRLREGAYSDPDLRALDTLLHEHRIGAW